MPSVPSNAAIRRLTWSLLAAVAMAAVPVVVRVSADGCARCLTADYWTIAPDYYKQTAPPTFPETASLNGARQHDFGVAFSGGGTRSAAATVGALRGLESNGWLDRVRYMSAVSGGAWAAVPFIYTLHSTASFLGAGRNPQCLAYADVVAKPEGLMADAIAKSSLAAVGLREGVAIAGDRFLGPTVANYIDRGLALLGKPRRDAERRDKTFGRLIGDRFIDPVVPKGASRRFALDVAQLGTSIRNNRLLNYTDFVTSSIETRPFLIVGASIVLMRPAGLYPRLVPIEYTPIYSGARRFDEKTGGTYISSWAYDSGRAVWQSFDEKAGQGTLSVDPGPTPNTFSIADVAASSGAAPQLFFLVGNKGMRAVKEALSQVAGFFPSYTRLSIGADRHVEATPAIPHGDGGFTDNIGLMPLLARQVHNVLVFVNTMSEFDGNADIESFFRPIQEQSGGGDRSLNAVFSDEHYVELRKGLHRRVVAREPVIYCGKNWTVLPNPAYNIRGYAGLNICWIYNHAIPEWHGQLSRHLQKMVEERLDDKDSKAEKTHAKNFKNFPWFSTFGQNKPHVIQLTIPQVNLLADLTWWAVTNQKSVTAILSVMNGVLPPPPERPGCTP